MAEIDFRLRLGRGLKELDERRDVSQAVASDRLKRWLS